MSKNQSLRDLAQEALTWIEGGGGRADSLCADLRAALAGAPVADEREMSPIPQIPTSYLQLKNLDKIHGLIRDYARAAVSAALASAPVAGKAVPPGYAILPVKQTPEMHDAVMELLYAGVPRTNTQSLLDAYVRSAPAAPQASEAQCSCPSGDGSLRHPCAVQPQASEAVQRAGYAAVTVWVGDRQATQIVTRQGLELSHKDALLERFEGARAALSAQPGAQEDRLPQRVMAQVALQWFRDHPGSVPTEEQLVEAFELKWG